MSVTTPVSLDARLEAFYRDFAPNLLGILMRELRRPRAIVEDGCQEAWAILARRPDVLDGPAPRAWLVTVAIRECIRALRRDPMPVDDLPDVTAPPLEDLLDARARRCGRSPRCGRSASACSNAGWRGSATTRSRPSWASRTRTSIASCVTRAPSCAPPPNPRQLPCGARTRDAAIPLAAEPPLSNPPPKGGPRHARAHRPPVRADRGH